MRFGYKLAQNKLSGNLTPFLLQFSITNACNLKCKYCYAKYYERKQKDLSKDQIFKIIDEVWALGTIRINLVGGEPLLRKDIGEIINYIKQKGMECALTSNGLLVEKKIDEIKSLDNLCLSLDGDREANDYNRGKGTYDKIISAIDIAKKHNIKTQVSSVLTTQTIKSLDSFIDLAKSKGFLIGFTTPISQTSSGETKPIENSAKDEELKQGIRKLIQIKEKGGPVLFSNESYIYALKWPYEYTKDKIIGEKPGFKIPKCYAGRYWGIIDVNGDIYPCPALVDVIQPANCLELGFKKAWKIASQHNCYTCHFPCNNEFNFMFGLNYKVLLNLFKNYQRRMPRSVILSEVKNLK